MKYTPLLLILLLLNFGCGKDSTNLSGDQLVIPQDEEGTLIRVMSYNIHHCNPPTTTQIDVTGIANVIIRANADLVALQEVDVYTNRSGSDLHQAEKLAELTGMYFYFFKSIDVHGGAYGNAVLSRYPIVEEYGYHLPMDTLIAGERRSVAFTKIILPTGDSILFASTHLDVREHRVMQAKKLVEISQERSLPLVLAGDFNDVEGSAALTILDQEFRRTCVGSACMGTVPVLNPTKTIDFIMFSPMERIITKSSTVIAESYASDHRPVFAEIIIKNKKK